MDVPISLGVLLAFGMSFYETVRRPARLFRCLDLAAVLPLIGRTLDHMMRERARPAVKGLARLAARGALVVQADGTQVYLPVSEIATRNDDHAGCRRTRTVDATVPRGFRTGRFAGLRRDAPVPAAVGSVLRAGTLNLTGPLTIVATATADNSFLGEMVRMMEAAEQGRSTYRRIADRAASLYAPVVHLTALLTFVGWFARDRRHTSRGDHRHCGSDHHLSLRARSCGADGAGRRGPTAVRERHHGEGRRRSGTPRGNRHGRVRQDRNADVGVRAWSARGNMTMRRSRSLLVWLPIPAILIRGRWSKPPPVVLRLASYSTKSPNIPAPDLRRARGAVVYRLGRPEWALADMADVERMSGDESVVLSKRRQPAGRFSF